MGLQIGGSKLMIMSQSVGHVCHEPLRFQPGARRNCARAREVVRRRERCAIVQPRLGHHDGWLPTRTPVRDAHNTARRPLQLHSDRGFICWSHGFGHDGNTLSTWTAPA